MESVPWVHNSIIDLSIVKGETPMPHYSENQFYFTLIHLGLSISIPINIVITLFRKTTHVLILTPVRCDAAIAILLDNLIMLT